MDRISWAEEDSKSLNNCNLYKFDPNEAINRIKSAKYLSGRTKKAVHLLLKWREKKAIEKNLPRQWILRDKTLVKIATTSIGLNSDFSDIKEISERFIKKNRNEVIEILEKSRISAEDYPPENKMNEKHKKIMTEMQKFIVKISKSLNIAPEIIATKKEIKLYLMEKNKSKLIKGWRKNLTEEKFLELTG
jgi:ribonuclease D